MIDLLNLGTITSKFGNRTSPTSGASTNHKGIDIVLSNYNIPAVVGGEVVENNYNSSMGNYVTIKDNNGFLHTYMHMYGRSSYRVGSKVSEGQTIGKMGSTGISTGDHLHYQVQNADGDYINPENYLEGATGTVNDSSGDNGNGLKWWGDIVKVVLCALLLIAGVVMFASGVVGSKPLKTIGGKKK